MRISDWSSDVCSSDFHRAMRDRAARIAQNHHRIVRVAAQAERVHRAIAQDARIAADRKSDVLGKSASGRVDLGGRRVIKKQTMYTTHSIECTIHTYATTTYITTYLLHTKSTHK